MGVFRLDISEIMPLSINLGAIWGILYFNSVGYEGSTLAYNKYQHSVRGVVFMTELGVNPEK